VKAFQPLESDPTKVTINDRAIKLAVKHFLGHSEESVRQALQATMEGHQRQILGTLTVEQLFKDRQSFSEKVRELVDADLDAMGYALSSYVVQSIDDENEYMESLGVAQTAVVRREAEEGRAMHEGEARRVVASSKAEADTAVAVENQRAHVCINEQFQEEAESDRNLNLKRAFFEREVNQAEAEAMSAGEIEEAKQRQTIVLEETKQKQVEEAVMLEVTDILVQRVQKEREGRSAAELLAESNHAKCITTAANAAAAEKRFVGQSEADVIQLRGKAEADVLRAKARAYKQFGEAAVVEMVVSKLPEITEELVKPLNAAEKMVFVSTSGETGHGGGNIMSLLGQLPDAVQGVTGVDLRKAAKVFAGLEQSANHQGKTHVETVG